MRRTEFRLRFDVPLAVLFMAGVYWQASQLGCYQEPGAITLGLAGMPLSAELAQILVDERLVRIDLDRSNRTFQYYLRAEGVAEERLFARIRELLQAEADGVLNCLQPSFMQRDRLKQ